MWPARFERLGARLLCLVACRTVLAVLEIALRLVEQLLRFGQNHRRVLFGARLARRANRLSRVAHLLHGCAHAPGQMDTDEEPRQPEPREHLS